MVYRIEIKDKPAQFDAVGEGIKKDILDLGINSIKEVRFIQVYNIEAEISEAQAQRICEDLLTDSISQDYFINAGCGKLTPGKNQFIVEVAYNPGVMDPVEDSILKGIKDLSIEGVSSVKTAKKYLIYGRLSSSQLRTISEKLLYNKLIQHIVKSIDPGRCALLGCGYSFNLVGVDLLSASDKKLQEISRVGQLFLNLPEMRQIKDYFKKLRRNPTDCELETIAQTWSEHCGHKTFRGRIKYTEQTPGKKKTIIINNLLKSTIMRVTKELKKSWCVSVFKDNSGVIRFDDKYMFVLRSRRITTLLPWNPLAEPIPA